MKRLALVILAACLASPAAWADANDTFNIRFSPLGLVLGMANARFDVKVSDQIVVGPSLVYWNVDISDIELQASGAAANLAYYFNQAYEHSAFIDFSAGYMDVEAETETAGGGTESAEVSSATGHIIGGYHWFWGNTFNLAVGGGLSFNTIGEIEIKDQNGNIVDRDDVPPVGLALEASLGFTF